MTSITRCHYKNTAITLPPSQDTMSKSSLQVKRNKQRLQTNQPRLRQIDLQQVYNVYVATAQKQKSNCMPKSDVKCCCTDYQ